MHSLRERRSGVGANSRQQRYILETLVEGLPPVVSDAKERILVSSREQESISKVAEDMRNREIAEMLQLSENTVKNHLFRIFSGWAFQIEQNLSSTCTGRHRLWQTTNLPRSSSLPVGNKRECYLGSTRWDMLHLA